VPVYEHTRARPSALVITPPKGCLGGVDGAEMQGEGARSWRAYLDGRGLRETRRAPEHLPSAGPFSRWRDGAGPPFASPSPKCATRSRPVACRNA
jgi:hypothetical protein